MLVTSVQHDQLAAGASRRSLSLCRRYKALHWAPVAAAQPTLPLPQHLLQRAVGGLLVGVSGDHAACQQSGRLWVLRRERAQRLREVVLVHPPQLGCRQPR